MLMKFAEAVAIFYSCYYNTVISALQLENSKEDFGVVRHVNGYIGTSFWQGASGEEASSEDNGNTLPQVGVPFAHSPFVPQSRNNEDKCVSPYYYQDPFFTGLRKTHFLSGSCVPEYGSVTLIPSLTLDINEALQFHLLNHDNEEWTPASYKVWLPESGIKMEAVNDNRAGIVSMDLSAVTADKVYLIIMSFDTMYNESFVDILSSSSAQVSNPAHRWYQAQGKHAGFDGHHHFEFSQPATSYGIIEGYTDILEKALSGKSSSQYGPVAAYFEFSRSDFNEVKIAVGSSFVSREKARANMMSELGGALKGDKEEDNGQNLALFAMEPVKIRVTAEWERRLSAIKVTPHTADTESDQESQLRMFYTALWHSLLLPRIYSDADGEYLSFAGSNAVMQQEEGYTYFDDYSEWDVYRATLPLQFIVASDIVPSLVHSLASKAEQGGWLPIFPAWNSYTNEMIGDHCSVLITDAYLKGLMTVEADPDFAEKIYHIMRHNALDVPSAADIVEGKGRRAIESYLKYGFVPLENPVPFAAHDAEQVSRTLEYAYDDYVLAQMADLLGFDNDRDLLLNHSEGYNWVVDAEGVGYVNGRHLNLSWAIDKENFDPDVRYSWLTEATAYQYTWYVPHQVEKLVDLFKGGATFTDKLTSFFEGGHYNHGNEPDHQAAFMFPYVIGTDGDAAWRTQYWVNSIMHNQYADGAGGLAGNDDAGQTSSWYAMAALGFYQVCPGCGGYSEYVLTTPTFSKASIVTHGGNIFEIRSIRNSKEDIYIQSAKLNGMEYNCAFLPHQLVVDGAQLEFLLGSSPNRSWGDSGRACLDVYFKKEA